MVQHQRNEKGRFEPTTSRPNDPEQEKVTMRDRTQSVPPHRRRSAQDDEDSGVESRRSLEPSIEDDIPSLEELIDSVREGKRRERGQSLHRSRGDSEVARRQIPIIESVSTANSRVNLSRTEEAELPRVVKSNLAMQLEEAQQAIRRLELIAANGAGRVGSAGPSGLPIRGSSLRVGPEARQPSPRVGADPPRAQDDYPMRNTPSRDRHREPSNVTFRDTASTHDSQLSSEIGNGKRRRQRSASSSNSSTQRYHGMRPRNVGTYTAKTPRHHQEWVRECENVFDIMKREYRSEGSKIRYATQWLPFDTREAWNRKEAERNGKGGPCTWHFFTEYLLDLIEDPTYRPFRSMQRYLGATQGDQLIQTFVTHLDQLERDIPQVSDELRYLILLCKMRIEVQQELLKVFPAPITRDGLVAAAARIEEGQRSLSTRPKRVEAPAQGERKFSNYRGQYRGSERSRGTSRPLPGRNVPPTSGRSQPHSEANRTQPTSRGGGVAPDHLSQVKCYACNKMGHYANTCTTNPGGIRAVTTGGRTGSSKK